VRRVNYPGLESHPAYAVARRQMWGFGGMLSFEVDERHATCEHFLRRLKLVTPALSLGGVETIICAPAATSHVKLTPAERTQLGISEGLLRLSVGIEDAEDILADIAQALSR
jgi:cystathionine beta-lyase